MLRYLSVFLIICLCLNTSAQSSMNNALKMRISDKTLALQFTILVKGNVERLKGNSAGLNYVFNYSAGDIASITTDLNSLSKLIEIKIVSRAEFIEATKIPFNDTMVVKNRIIGVKTGTPPLPQAYDGTGVVVGIIDTGTDWRHLDFKDAGGNTRIQYIWEQSVFGGTATPQPYNYGKEWTAAQINALQCTHNDVAGSGHGTHVSGVAVGNGLQTGKFQGVAPKADIVVVALNFNLAGPTIADAVNYIFSKATLMGKPCVINASVGDYNGSHDGTDLEAKLIENMVKNIGGRVMVAAGGNAGTARSHVKTIPPVGDTAWTWLNNTTSYNLFYAVYADTAQIKNVQINIGANRKATYFNLGSIGFKPYNYGLVTQQIDTLKHLNQRIGILKTSASINAYGVYELYVKIISDTLDLLWRVESKGVGLHHSWNFDFHDRGVGISYPTVGVYPRMVKCVRPDTLMTIVSSFQCIDDITTVANYMNLTNYTDMNNNLQPSNAPGGSKSTSSSLGPTRDGRQKPDIAATGDGVFAALCVGLQASYTVSIPQFVAPGGKHVFGSGTSAASPVVAGFAALFLQRYPTATSYQVKKAITNCAYTDAFTGTLTPTDAWGYGKLDGLAAMQCYIALNKNEIKINDNLISAFPNPFSDKASITFKSEVNGKINVYTIDGKLIFTDKISGNNYDLKASNFNSDYKGILFVRVISSDENISFKLIRTN